MRNLTDERHLIVSCVFGPQFNKLYRAIPGYRNIFFSNNYEIRDHAIVMGWNFNHVDFLPISNDILVSSLQSKWVKYLQFFQGRSDLDEVTHVTYYDYKFKLQNKHIKWIGRNLDPSSDILIRETPRLKLSISDEIHDAMNQERYARHMPETVNFLDDLEPAGNISRNVRIVNTGLIHFRNLEKCRRFTKVVYETCTRLSQPECQIIWAVLSQLSQLSQLSSVRIQKVPWTSLDPIWKVPKNDSAGDKILAVLNKIF